MRRPGKFAAVLAIGLGAIGVATFGQGPPPPPPPAVPGQPLPHLSDTELALWRLGKTSFQRPATIDGGLGPVFNESSCVQCHGGSRAVGGSGLELVTRFGRIVNNQFDPMIEFGGPSLQSKGIGRFNGVNFVGEVVPRQATIVAKRRTTPLYGLGLVEAVDDATLMNLADRQHHDNPSTAGIPSFVLDGATGIERVGRFGWKAQQATLYAFVGDAYVNEMGVTTPFLPNENCPQGNCALLKANPALTNPNEPDNDSIEQISDFLAFTAPPSPPPTSRGPVDPKLLAGQAVFGMLGCAQCHQPTLVTGSTASPSLHGVTFAPYSDFLLHDMGRLGDGIVQNEAGPTQMRTAPLWGLRFEKSFLHDGRASTVDQAIIAHAGQGQAASQNYARLKPDQKAQLLAFLNSL